MSASSYSLSSSSKPNERSVSQTNSYVTPQMLTVQKQESEKSKRVVQQLMGKKSTQDISKSYMRRNFNMDLNITKISEKVGLEDRQAEESQNASVKHLGALQTN
mmetsp:Transcript_14525/g.22539  ORF Transcript_14525/g.22539 Transcript_14525/m.22539 type:complete len:104 (+) Transcript_14525:1750-2061(+)